MRGACARRARGSERKCWFLSELWMERRFRRPPRSGWRLPIRRASRTTFTPVFDSCPIGAASPVLGLTQKTLTLAAADLVHVDRERGLVGQVEHGPLAVLMPGGQVKHVALGAARRRQRPTGRAPAATTPCGPGRSSSARPSAPRPAHPGPSSRWAARANCRCARRCGGLRQGRSSRPAGEPTAA